MFTERLINNREEVMRTEGMAGLKMKREREMEMRNGFTYRGVDRTKKTRRMKEDEEREREKTKEETKMAGEERERENMKE